MFPATFLNSKHYPKPNSPTDQLITAAEKGDLVKVASLINSKVNVTTPNSVGNTAISAATSSNKYDVVTVLFPAGAMFDKNVFLRCTEDQIKKTKAIYKQYLVTKLMDSVKVDQVNPQNNDAKAQPAQPEPMLPFPVSGGHELLFKLVVDYMM